MPVDTRAEHLQVHLSALMTYRVAIGVQQHLMPIDALRNHTLGSARGLELRIQSARQLRQPLRLDRVVGVDL
jgi:hypothetical protein